jgi:hypothetical protein
MMDIFYSRHKMLRTAAGAQIENIYLFTITTIHQLH